MNVIELSRFFNFDDAGKGSYKDFDVIASQIKEGYYTYPVLILRFETEMTQDVFNDIRKKHKKLGNIVLGKNKRSLFIVCVRLLGKVKEEKLLEFVNEFDMFIESLKNYNFETLHSCTICGQEKDEELEEHVIEGNYVLTHKSCFEEYKNYKVDQIMENETNTSKYPISIIFAFLGALVGFLPFLIVALVSGYLFGYGFILIPFASYYGYKLGKAPLNKKAMVIITVASSIMLVLGVLLLLLVIKSALELENNTTIAFKDVITACAGDIAFCAIFGVAGIIYAVNNIKKNTNERKLDDIR